MLKFSPKKESHVREIKNTPASKLIFIDITERICIKFIFFNEQNSFIQKPQGNRLWNSLRINRKDNFHVGTRL